MARFRVTDPTSGRVVTLSSDDNTPPTDQELEEIFSSLPPQEKYIGLPKLQETEQKISQRPDAMSELNKEVMYKPNPYEHPIRAILKPLVTGIKAANVPLQRGESAIASTGLALQRGKPQDIAKDVGAAISGERNAQLGDVVRTTGFGGAANEPIAAITGLLSLLGVGGKPAAKATETGAKTAGKIISKKTPRIMNETWFENEAKLAQKTAGGLEKMRGAAYENAYKKIGGAPIEPIKVNDILKKYDLVEELGSPTVTNVADAKAFSDELSQFIPQQIKQGKTFGKGGFANPKIRAEKAAKEIKDLIYQSAQDAENAKLVDSGSTQSLKNLDKLSHEKLYPRAEKIRKIGGYESEPETSGVAGAYRILQGSEGSAGKRLAIKRAPEALKELEKFLPQEKQFDLAEALKNAEQLKKNMGKYRGRQITKAITTGGGLLGTTGYLLHRGITDKMLYGGRQ